MNVPSRDEPWSPSLTRALLEWADRDEQREWFERVPESADAQRELAARWRMEHRELVDRLDDHAPEVLAELYERDTDRPPLEHVLLLLLSDPLDHGWDLARYFCDSLKDDVRRDRAETLIEQWSRTESDLASHVNVLIVGGIAREAKAQLARLEAQDVRGVDWIPIARGQGRAFNVKALARVRNAAALVIVTGRISHGLMHVARDEAEAHGVPVYYVERATEQQLDEVLRQIGAAFG